MKADDTFDSADAGPHGAVRKGFTRKMVLIWARLNNSWCGISPPVRWIATPNVSGNSAAKNRPLSENNPAPLLANGRYFEPQYAIATPNLAV